MILCSRCGFQACYETLLDDAWSPLCRRHFYEIATPAHMELSPGVARRIRAAMIEDVVRSPIVEADIPMTPSASSQRKRREKPTFRDMEPGPAQVEGRPGSVLAIALALCRDGGATLEQLATALGPNHDPLRLLSWANEKRGWGWRRDESGRIHPVP